MCLDHIFRLERKRVPAASALFLCSLYTITEKTVKANKRGGIEMVPWWVLMLAFLAGAALGLFMAALLIADERDDRP